MSVTRLTWLAVAAGVMILGCGEGRAIFNIDVLSYEPGLADTVPYAVPGGTSITQRDSFGLDLPGGLGNSIVDSVTLQYGSTVLNAGGAGSFTLQVSFDSIASTVFSSPVVQVDTTISWTGPDTVVVGPITVPLLADTLFTKSQLWVGVRASVVANTAMTGRFVTVSVLRLRIIFQDKVF
jgi:hypothetical protein